MGLFDRGTIAMRTIQYVAIALAGLLLIGGLSAIGAASPVDRANATSPADRADDNYTDANEQHVPEDIDDATEESDDRAGNADEVGPVDGLPEQVPDHVSRLHENVESYLNGSNDNLGELLSGGEQVSETADESREQMGDDDVEPDA